MKKFLFYITVVVMTGAALMTLKLASGQPTSAGEEVNQDFYLKNFCFEGKYETMDSSDAKKVYVEKTNDLFNEYIKQIMTHPTKNDPVPTLDDYDKNKLTFCADKNDVTCRTIAVCQNNSSAYCLGVNSLGFDGRNYFKFNNEELQQKTYLKYSYFCYKAVLESKLDSIEEETGQAILNKCNDPDSKYKDDKICSLKKDIEKEKDPETKARGQRALDQLLQAKGYSKNITGIGASVVERANRIILEIRQSKQTLDAALEAYSQLQMAWRLHVKYIDIYNALVDYRDALVEIRKQTDQFPNRFIDATTTKCA